RNSARGRLRPWPWRRDVAVACGFGFPLRCMRIDRGRRDLREHRHAKENCMSGNVTEVLAGFAASLQYDDLPAEVRDHCKNLLLAALRCASAGHRGEATHMLAALVSGLAQSTESSVIGGEALSLAGATILNGYLVTAVTMCDVHRSTLTHVTPEVMPPALAI